MKCGKCGKIFFRFTIDESRPILCNECEKLIKDETKPKKLIDIYREKVQGPLMMYGYKEADEALCEAIEEYIKRLVEPKQ